MYNNHSTVTIETITNLNMALVISEEDYVDSYSGAVKAVFAILAFLSMITFLFALAFLYRTKKIPYATKCLATGLLSFDALFVVTSSVRKFITDHVVIYNLQTISVITVQMTVFTICLMSIERYFVFSNPMVYLRVVSKQPVKRIVILAWICDLIICIFMRYGVCYLHYWSKAVFVKPGYCNSLMAVYYGILQLAFLCIACFCYVKIFHSINKVNSLVTSSSRKMRCYRSTYLTFIYLSIIVLSSLGYIIILILMRTKTKEIQYTTLRLAMEVVSLINCILDPVLYVFWFKECRLQFLKLLAIFSNRYAQRAAKLSIDVYHIVTYNKDMDKIKQNDTLTKNN